MSKADVDELLKDIEEQLISIKKYKKITKVKLKSILENLRSSLEYMAQDINSALSKKKTRIYFPYGDTKEIFKERINQNLPAIQSEYPALYDCIEHLQPHKNNGDKWLVDMCRMTNDAKHKKLLEVKNEGNDNVILSSGGIPIFGFIDCENSIIKAPKIYVRNKDGSLTDQGMMGTYYIDGENVEIIEENNPLVDFSIVEKKKLVIDGKTPIEVIPFLEKCFNKISQFSTDVYTQLK
ncbi:hypothetical protein HMPREF2844_11155 [Neisseria sp. HMSC072F04]|jgi:hypothetical protein|uniref:hypothetical protein n=1 Tax=Neisseria sicca TaxID=490 RepID=UPI0008A4AA6F|nr:hypothetical protein [Neisseria sicca]OFJ85124.1 hypothetical protein HMPREF2844_11155 [Neisseria sp. HMSC072F04]